MSEGTGTGGPSSGEARIPRRDQVMDALCEAYARDEFGMEELERRLDVATRAPSAEALMALLEDLDRKNLPVALGGTTSARPEGEEGRNRSRESDGQVGDHPGALQVPPGLGQVDPSRVPDRQFEVAFLSGRTRKGSWVPGRQITAMACLGGVDLDFREAMFGTETVEIFATAVMGGVEILVPPGVHVDMGGFAFMGSFEEDSSLDPVPAPGTPTIRVRGFACMGAVEVVVRLPGESAGDARRRRKKERRKRLKSGDGD